MEEYVEDQYKNSNRYNILEVHRFLLVTQHRECTKEEPKREQDDLSPSPYSDIYPTRNKKEKVGANKEKGGNEEFIPFIPG
jgi:hypothetical protein